MKLEDLLIEQIIGLNLKVLCNDGELHNISFFDFMRCENPLVSLKYDKSTEKAPKEIEVHIKCNNYSVGIDIEDNG